MTPLPCDALLGLLKKIAVDVTPIRESRDFRLLAIGGTISAFGTQAALVALPIQIYVLSHSPALVGLLGLFELGPMIVVSLIGGAIADRRDRRPVLAAAQVGMIVVTALLFALSTADHSPPVIAILILGGLLAGCTALDGVARGLDHPRASSGPSTCAPGSPSTTACIRQPGSSGPAVGGVVIGACRGVRWMYLFDAVSCVGMLRRRARDRAAAAAHVGRPPAGRARRSRRACVSLPQTRRWRARS